MRRLRRLHAVRDGGNDHGGGGGGGGGDGGDAAAAGAAELLEVESALYVCSHSRSFVVVFVVLFSLFLSFTLSAAELLVVVSAL
jgi:hypothetical protein